MAKYHIYKYKLPFTINGFKEDILMKNLKFLILVTLFFFVAGFAYYMLFEYYNLYTSYSVIQEQLKQVCYEQVQIVAKYHGVITEISSRCMQAGMYN